mmetsp:Transcript_1219/g.2844  ORF Transcript_1219/g.2844 Transcript_1219/m.2844 type:complete len:166 (-) Transcript_1219:19-516(-)
MRMNWGFAAIPAAFAVGLVPVAVRGFLVYRHNNDLTPDLPGETAIARGLRVHGIANVAPRQAVDALRGRIAESDHRLLRRCDGAAANASEALPLFASAVLAAHAARLPQRWIAVASGGYLLSRCAYTAAYLLQEEPLMAAARTTAWTAGTVTCLGMMLRAARAAA